MEDFLLLIDITDAAVKISSARNCSAIDSFGNSCDDESKSSNFSSINSGDPEISIEGSCHIEDCSILVSPEINSESMVITDDSFRFVFCFGTDFRCHPSS